jgi:hypothetical protein
MRWIGCTAALLWFSSAHAFQILTPVSEPCHENITLGAFDLKPPPFGVEDDLSLAETWAFLVAKAEASGIPTDELTRGAIRQVSSLYGISDLDLATKYVMTSLIIGARDPDTRGFSVLRVNVARATHIDNRFQAPHSLRRTTDDHLEGNASAIENAKVYLQEIVQAAHSQWWSGEEMTVSAVWTFPFYGEGDVQVFGPAFRIGLLSHAIQDSFTHALRDEEGRIATVLNFVEAATRSATESRDGLPHSDRMDECDTSSQVDLQRIGRARQATVLAIASYAQTMALEEYEPMIFRAALDEIYAHRPGCSVENDYCDNPDLTLAKSALTGPINIGCQSQSVPMTSVIASLSLLTFIAVLARRRRGRLVSESLDSTHR